MSDKDHGYQLMHRRQGEGARVGSKAGVLSRVEKEGSECLSNVLEAKNVTGAEAILQILERMVATESVTDTADEENDGKRSEKPPE